jgi:rhodanese-related sulfurtransferase
MNLDQNTWWDQYLASEDAIIIDVRTDDEIEEIKIPGSINLDIYKGQEFLQDLENLDKSKTYFVYCRSGARSAQAIGIMKQIGFEKAFNLEGGILAWQGVTE